MYCIHLWYQLKEVTQEECSCVRSCLIWLPPTGLEGVHCLLSSPDGLVYFLNLEAIDIIGGALCLMIVVGNSMLKVR